MSSALFTNLSHAGVFCALREVVADRAAMINGKILFIISSNEKRGCVKIGVRGS